MVRRKIIWLLGNTNPHLDYESIKQKIPHYSFNYLPYSTPQHKTKVDNETWNKLEKNQWLCARARNQIKLGLGRTRIYIL